MTYIEPATIFRLKKAGFARVTSLLVIASFLITTVFPYMPLQARAQEVEEEQEQGLQDESVTTPENSSDDDSEERDNNEEAVLGESLQLQAQDDDDDPGADKVTICHYDADEDVYDQLSVDDDSITNGEGHTNHEQDIIPPFDAFVGQNWDVDGQVIWNDDCAATGTVIITKIVVNDNGGTSTVSDFDLSVGDTSVESGVATEIAAGDYVVSETPDDGRYEATFSGDCDAEGNIDIGIDATSTCTITNDDVGSQEPGGECRIEVVSEAGDDGVGNGDAVLAWIHGGWTTALSTVASWIWDTEFVIDPTIDEEKTFTKDFYVDTEVNDATLRLAADNRYTITINGDVVAADTDELNYGAVTEIEVATSTIDQGWNTIVMSIENIGVPDSTAETNPAAGIFQLVINGEANEDCDVPPGDDDDDDFVKVHIYKYLAATTTAQVPDSSTLDPFPMRASWDATNIGAGTGDYVLGNNHGGAAFRYAADTSDMATPVTSYTTFERTTAIDGGSQVLPVGAQCESDMFRLVGYKSGTSLAAAEAATATTTAPIFTNFSADQYVIVVNEDCDDLPEPPVDTNGTTSIKIIKTVVGTTTSDTFDFDAGWLDQDVDFSLLSGASTTYTGLATGTYALSEVFGTSTEWELESVVCTDNNASTTNTVSTTTPGVNATVTLAADEDVICTFTNGLVATSTPPATTTGTLIVTKTVINDSGTGSATTSDYTLSVIGNGATTTVTSGIAGAFATGTYSVIEAGPGGYTATFGGDCNAQGQVTVAAGATSTCTIVNDDLVRLPDTTSISGTKWNDLNDNGVRDSGEPGVAGVTISISDDATTTPFATTTVTDANGDYSFINLDEDIYFICETVQNGWTQTYPTNGTAPFTDCQGSFGHVASTSLAAASTTDITDLDFGNFEENQCPVSLTIVSDASTTVDEQGGSAADLVTFIHPAWTASIAGASWIWGDDPVADPAATTTYTFTRTFNWNGSASTTSALLEVAADNSYTVTLNGTGVGTSTDGNNFALGTQDSYDISSMLVNGTNTLQISVTNFSVPGATDPQSNPAGVMFRISANGNDTNCVPPSGDDDDDDNNQGDDDDDNGGGGSSSSRRRSSNNGNTNGGGSVLGASTSNTPDDGQVLGAFFPGFPNTGEGGGMTQTLGYLLLAVMAAIVTGASFKLFKRS